MILTECNLLGSGPRRNMFIDNLDMVNIGCNFPWTRFDYTIIDHRAPLYKLISTPESIPEPTKLVISNNCLKFLKEENFYNQLKDRIDSVFVHYDTLTYGIKNRKKNILNRSSLHYAAEWAIYKGFKKLNIYGCDNWFGDLACTKNWSHTPNTVHYIDPTKTTFLDEHALQERGKKWIETWKYLIKYYSNVEFNFV
jgi:hypothetical protein